MWFGLIYISWRNVFFFLHQIKRYKTVVQVFTNVEAFQDIFFPAKSRYYSLTKIVLSIFKL